MVELQEVIKITGVDLSGGFSAAFEFLIIAFSNVVEFLDHLYILPGLSVLTLFIVIVILGMIISSVFVLYSGDIDD